MKASLNFLPYRLLLSMLFTSTLTLPSVTNAQDHASHMSGSPKATSQCQGSGLECANAATPFFGQDGKLFLAWMANGVVSVAQSNDQGKTFSAAIKISEHGKSLDTGSDARPQILADQSGNIFLAYAFFKDSNWNAQINTSRSSDGGKTFSTPESLVQDSSSQRFPSALIRPDGSIFMSWVDKRLVAAAKQGGEKRLGGSIAYSFSQDGGKTFQAERIANDSSCECCRIGASLDPKDQPVIIYRAIFPGGIRDQATQVISARGTEPIRRVADDQWKTDACPHHGPSIAVSGTGKFHVAWYTQGSKRSGVFYANSTNQGITYSKPSRVGAEGVSIARPYLLAIGQQIWLVWKEFDGSKSSIYLKESQDDGNTWSNAKLLAGTAGYSDHPLLLSRGGEVFLSWLTRNDGYQFIRITNQ